jgi:hypothetical protein
MRKPSVQPRQVVRPGDYCAIPLSDGNYGCVQLMAISKKMGPLIQVMDYKQRAHPDSKHVSRLRPMRYFYMYASTTNLNNGRWPVIGHGPLLIDPSHMVFVMVDEFVEPPRGTVMVNDQASHKASPIELSTLPIYSIVGADLVEMRIAAELH